MSTFELMKKRLFRLLLHANNKLIDRLINVLNTYLTRAIYAVGAVILVDDDRVFNIGHDGMLEEDVLGKSGAGSAPRFDPQPVLCASEHNVLDGHVLNPCLLKVLP